MKNLGNFRLPVLLILAIMLSFKPAHAVITKIYHQIICSGTQVLVPVYVWDFDTVGSLSLTIEYDGSVLQFEEIQYINPLLSMIAINNVPGNPSKIRMASYTLLCQSLPDSSIFATIRFTLNGQFSPLTWPATPGFNEYSNCMLGTIPSQFIAGSVGASSLQILSQPPAIVNCCEGVDTNLAFQAAGNGNIQYQWYTSMSPGGPWMIVTPSPLFSNTTTSGLDIQSVPAGLNQAYFRCTVSDGCQSVMTGPIQLNVIPCGQIIGQLVYDNAAGSAMPVTPLLVNQGANPIQTVQTDTNGLFSVNSLPYGNYTVIPGPLLAPGGINAADAMLILTQFVNPNTLTGLAKKSGDVDGSGYINALDALLVAKYFVGLIASFPAGVWVSEEPDLQINGVPIPQLIIKTRCYGDVDGSFVP